MKKLLTLALTGLIASSLFAYDIVSDMQLKTKAKTITRTDFSIVSKFGEYFRTPSTKYVYQYDGSGRLIESSELTPRDVIINKITSSYDALGNLSGEICFDSDNTQMWNTTFTYKDNLKTECAQFGKGGYLKGKTIYSYTNNNLTDESYYNADGTLVWKIISNYNSSNQLENEYEYFGDGTLDEERIYSYNEAGLKDSITYYDSMGKVKSKDIFRYDSNRNLSEITKYDADNKIIKRTLVKLDSFGNCSKVTEYNVVKKFGTTINEMVDMTEFIYDYNVIDIK